MELWYQISCLAGKPHVRKLSLGRRAAEEEGRKRWIGLIKELPTQPFRTVMRKTEENKKWQRQACIG